MEEKITDDLNEVQSETEENTGGAHINFETNTFQIVSKVAYLIGIRYSIFENENEPPQMVWHEQLKEHKAARIIRNLCMIRTQLMRGYGQINTLMRYELKNLNSLPDYIDQEALKQLKSDGIDLVKANCRLNQYFVDINLLITDRINQVKDLFPMWVNWEYIKKLFLMPNGNKVDRVYGEVKYFNGNLKNYPYASYINWKQKYDGNILYNDEKFVSLLYHANGDQFTDFSKVNDAKGESKESIFNFIEEGELVDIIVDCENSDVYKLLAIMQNLQLDGTLDKIYRIYLIDDEHTNSAWDILQEFIDKPIEHKIINRISEEKSRVDMALAVDVMREHYRDNVDSFILFASDSDYWTLMDQVKEARFLVMIERDKCGYGIRKLMDENEILYCYIDDFCTDHSSDMKAAAVLKDIRKFLQNTVNFNIQTVLKQSLKENYIEMTPTERKQFYNRYLKGMKLKIDEKGNVSISLN